MAALAVPEDSAMIIDLLKAFAVGVLAALPLGPVCVLVAQKTISRGRLSGMFAGAGSMVADTFYAVVCLFTVSLVKDFLVSHEGLILLVGGFLIIVVGLVMFQKKEQKGPRRNPSKKRAVGYAFQAMGCAFSNPGALLLMFAYISVFELQAGNGTTPVWLIVPFVALGEFSYWFLFTGILSRFDGIKPETITRINKIFGSVIMVLGLSASIRGLIILL